MGESESVTRGNESAASIIEQLGKAFIELKSHEGTSENKVQWKDIEEYFQNYETLLKTKSNELEEKRKAFETKESEIRKLISEREAVVAAKEQDSLDRVQELKDAAVAVIMEARDKYKFTTPDPVDVDGNAENKVCSDDPDGPLSAPDENSPHRSGEHAGAVEVQPRPELTQFCAQMDGKGLLNFIVENRKSLAAIREEIPVALKSASDPARLVLDSLEGFYPSDQTTLEANKRDAALQGMRRSCVMLLGSVAPLLVGTELDDQPLNPETKQRAKAMADEWKPRLVEAGIDAANGNSLEADAFLQLIATFRIASEFDEEELCKLVLAIARRRQAPELCRSLGLTHKMPGVVEMLINSGRQVDAVHFVQAFNLTESFPPVPLLKTYLKDLRRSTQGTAGNAGPGSTQNDANARELVALKAVIKCIDEYKLEGDYPLAPLQKRVTQLEKAKADKKRSGDAVRHQQPKKPRSNGGYYGPRMPSIAANRQPPPVFGDMGAYMGASERYPPVGATAFNYQAASQGIYGQPDPAQRSYYYPQDARGNPNVGPYNSAASNPGAYSAASNPGAYMGGGGMQSSHQSFI